MTVKVTWNVSFLSLGLPSESSFHRQFLWSTSKRNLIWKFLFSFCLIFFLRKFTFSRCYYFVYNLHNMIRLYKTNLVWDNTNFRLMTKTISTYFLTSHLHLRQNITKCLFTKVKKNKVRKFYYQSKSCWIDRDFRRNESWMKYEFCSCTCIPV